MIVLYGFHSNIMKTKNLHQQSTTRFGFINPDEYIIKININNPPMPTNTKEPKQSHI